MTSDAGIGRQADLERLCYNVRTLAGVALMTASANINIRTTPSRKQVIDQAAHLLGRNRSEFVLEAAEDRAREVLMDQKNFALDVEQFARFNQLLDEPLPAEAAQALARLLSRKAPWES